MQTCKKVANLVTVPNLAKLHSRYPNLAKKWQTW